MEETNNPFVEQEENETSQTQEVEVKEEIAEEITEETAQQENYKEQYEDLNNKYIRLAADFDNFRKRTQAEKESLSKYANADLMLKLTTILDTFDRAQESLKDVENCETVKTSYEVAFKQLIDVLKKAGLEQIEALGVEFNPNEHEAISQIETEEYPADTVAQVAQKGYKLIDKVLRPALVVVAKEKENE